MMNKYESIESFKNLTKALVAKQAIPPKPIKFNCETLHDRDINSAINIAILGAKCLPSICGNGLSASFSGWI